MAVGQFALITEPPIERGQGNGNGDFFQRYGLFENYLSKRPIPAQAWSDGLEISNPSACPPSATSYPQSICDLTNAQKPAATPVLTQSPIFLPHWNLVRATCSSYPLDLPLEPYAARWLEAQQELLAEADLALTLAPAPVQGAFTTLRCALAAAEQSLAATTTAPRSVIYAPVRAASLLFNDHGLVPTPNGLFTHLGNRIVVLRESPTIQNRIWISVEDRTEVWVSDPTVLPEETYKSSTALTNDRFVTYEVAHILLHLACSTAAFAWTECDA